MNAPGPMKGSGTHYSQTMVDQTPKFDSSVRKGKRKKKKKKYG